MFSRCNKNFWIPLVSTALNNYPVHHLWKTDQFFYIGTTTDPGTQLTESHWALWS